MKCSSCSYELSRGSRFCSECGTEQFIHCTQCNSKNPIGSDKCINCRYDFSNNAVRTADNFNINSLVINSGSFKDIPIEITECCIKGPYKDKTYKLFVKFHYRNCTDKLFDEPKVTIQLYTLDGILIDGISESIYETLEPNKNSEVEFYINDLAKEIIDNYNGKLKIFINISATIPKQISIGSAKLPLKAYDFVPLRSLDIDDTLKVVASSLWISNPDHDDDVNVCIKMYIQSFSDKAFPPISYKATILTSEEEEIKEFSDEGNCLPDSFLLLNSSAYLQKALIEDCRLELSLSYPQIIAQGGSIVDFLPISPADHDEDEDEEINDNGDNNELDDEEEIQDNQNSHTIFVKTEPGGRIIFGELDSSFISIIETSLKTKTLHSNIDDLRFNSNGDFLEAEGVVNSGNDGDFGNEGIISIDGKSIKIPTDEKTGKYKNGLYYLFMSLSKVSIEFEFSPEDEEPFDANKFSEVSIPASFPDIIEHQLYGKINFNIVTGYQYNNKSLIEYDGDLVDRGYEDQVNIIAVVNGDPKLIYQSFRDEEIWGDPNYLDMLTVINNLERDPIEINLDDDTSYVTETNNEISNSTVSNSYIRRLEALEKLALMRDKGLISEEEMQKQKKMILDNQ